MGKFGRPRAAEEDRRKHRVACRITDAELKNLDKLRGGISRGEWMRRSAFGKPPRPVPEINIQAHGRLGNALGNLATIAIAMRQGYYAELDECRTAVKALRNQLLGVFDEDENH